MRKVRTTAAAAVSLALLGASATIGSAGAAAPGVGTSLTTTDVVHVQVGNNGSLLDLSLIGDEARATIDPRVATPEAYSRLIALRLRSSVLPAPLNDLTVPTPALEARAPGGQGSVSGPTINLGNPAPGVNVPSAVLSGSVSPAALTAVLEGGSAKSTLNASLGGVNLAGSLVSARSVASTLGATGSPQSAIAERGVKVDAVTVLDLGALLQGLGINLKDLPISTVTALLSQLQATVPGVGDGAAVQKLIDDVQAQITALAAAASGVSTGAVAQIVTDLGLGGVVDTSAINGISDPVARANELVDQLQIVLADVLGDSLSVLDNLALLKLGGVEVGIKAVAADTLEASTADVVAKIGDVQIGNLTIPGVDLLRETAKVTSLVNSVNDQVKGVLSVVDPGLANLVNVEIFKPTKSVSTSDGYNRARAGITALSATIKPPAALGSIVSTIEGATGAADVITGAGGSVPVLSTAMTTLRTTLGTSLAALAQGATVNIAEVRAASDFTSAASAPVSAPGGTLPRTGGSAGLVGLGLLMVVAALGIRRRLLHPVQG